jgi:multidrug transporter EmrE-like cation transporter
MGFYPFMRLWRRHWKAYCLMGGTYAAIILIMNIALFGQNLAYYAVIKRVSIVLAALYGLYVLREGVSGKDRKTRILMSIIVFIGIALIAIGG